MSGKSDRWADLAPRLISALLMLAVGVAAIWAGGTIFLVLAALVCAGMTWELARMTAAAPAPREALALAGLAGVSLMVIGLSGWVSSLALLVLPALIGALRPRRDMAAWCIYAPIILATGVALVLLQATAGVIGLLWLITVVIVSDVAGYFAGRILGGPKFWPRLSPKKTWSGTVAGWIGAVLVGWFFHASFGMSSLLLVISPALAFAGQLGDIAESAIKRRAGVKDASNLLPGHGGLMDRFDALAFAAVLAAALDVVTGFLAS